MAGGQVATLHKLLGQPVPRAIATRKTSSYRKNLQSPSSPGTEQLSKDHSAWVSPLGSPNLAGEIES